MQEDDSKHSIVLVFFLLFFFHAQFSCWSQFIIDSTSSPKNQIFVMICSPYLLETCKSFYLLLNTKEDILKNAGKQTVDGSHCLL